MIGRCARNVNAQVILYAERITKSMRKAIDETSRRREIQAKHNEEHQIQPRTIRKAIREGIEKEMSESRYAYEAVGETEEMYLSMEQVKELEEEMHTAAEELEFERAAELRDCILKIKGEFQASAAAVAPQKRSRRRSRKARRR